MSVTHEAISITVPIRVVSEANRASHEHWRGRADRTKQVIGAVTMALNASPLDRKQVPAHVHMVRCAPRSLDPMVNLPSSLKATQDAVARWYGVDDGVKSPVGWSCAQEKSSTYAVRIEVTT